MVYMLLLLLSGCRLWLLLPGSYTNNESGSVVSVLLVVVVSL